MREKNPEILVCADWRSSPFSSSEDIRANIDLTRREELILAAVRSFSSERSSSRCGDVVEKAVISLVKSSLSFSAKQQASFHFMAEVTICSDFEAQENKVFHCFHCFPIYLA